MSLLKLVRRSSLYLLAIPLLLWTLGAGLNQIAVNANHDAMPVLYNAGNVKGFIRQGYPIESQGNILTDSEHCVLTSTSRTYLLDDIIDFGDVKYSIGDVLLFTSEELLPVMPYIWGVALYAKLRREED